METQFDCYLKKFQMPRRIISKLATMVIKVFLCREKTLKFSTVCSQANLNKMFMACNFSMDKIGQKDIKLLRNKWNILATKCCLYSQLLQNTHSSEGSRVCLSTSGFWSAFEEDPNQ